MAMPLSTSSGHEQLHVAVLPFLAFGHIFPFVHLSNKLHTSGVKVTFLSPPTLVSRIRTTLLPSISIVNYTLSAVDGLPPGKESTADVSPARAELLKIALDGSNQQISDLLRQLSPHAVIFDFALEWLPPLAASHNIKPVFFSLFTAISSAYITIPSRKPTTHDTSEIVKSLQMPPAGFPSMVTGLKHYEAMDVTYVFRTFAGMKSSVFDRVVSAMERSSAIILKSAVEMEGPFIDFLSLQYHPKPVLLAGPIVPADPVANAKQLEAQWAEWLGGFSEGSVVFCSFGSETFLSADQMRELVAGLEMSGLPFLAILNCPPEMAKAKEEKLREEIFGERAGGRGMVRSGWVQQPLILAHPSVGYYLCHGGYSSIIEAVISSCQLVLLPQKGDQFLNTKLIAEGLKAGVAVERRDEDGWFDRNDVFEAMKEVMSGELETGKMVRANAAKLKQFLLNETAQQDYIHGLVVKLQELVASQEY